MIYGVLSILSMVAAMLLSGRAALLYQPKMKWKVIR